MTAKSQYLTRPRKEYDKDQAARSRRAKEPTLVLTFKFNFVSCSSTSVGGAAMPSSAARNCALFELTPAARRSRPGCPTGVRFSVSSTHQTRCLYGSASAGK